MPSGGAAAVRNFQEIVLGMEHVLETVEQLEYRSDGSSGESANAFRASTSPIL